ncbi:MAG: ABC transporter permease subunit [Bacillota bacterium]|nr:ABC transporter permease subunit [Bacillota bacterium]
MNSILKSKKSQKIFSVIFALLIWQAAAMIFNQKILLASPLEVIERLTNIWTEEGFFASLWFSFSRIAGGFILALISGILLAVMAGRFNFIETLLWPFMVTIKSIPVASFIIISLVWLTSNELSSFISFLVVLPIIYTNVLSGIKNTDAKMAQMADVFKLNWSKRLLYIWMPQIKPFLISACSVALGFSWKSGIAAEVIGIPNGSIGEMLYEAKVYFKTVDLFSITIIIVLISITLEKLFLALIRLGFRRLERI